MYKGVAVLAAIALAATTVSATEDTEVAATGRDGTISLSGGSGSSFWTNALYIVPLLAAIIILDFAIFGTFATRSDELNPVSRFFFKAKEGLHIIQNRNTLKRYSHHHKRPSSPYGIAPDHHHRHTR